ncbi:tellurite resistance TerB family protein [Ciceribacter sp. L1K23]|uniref:tellurite resistance TerB family protein n=1 Tax=Ciceribacter sp. L1K23 TaxID=2820276 RepID=UPI001B81D2C5|nr:tellurite resistance TerB family protein [Ciceribacter sp. L1K23]MBR0558102.1 tellurite resistance TerB family protein [Ciceribacter sp. L1K23]
MFDAKKLLDQFLGSQIPGTQGTVKGTAGSALDLAKKNPLASGALAAVLLGTKAGRNLTGSAVKLGGLAAIAGLGYLAYRNYKTGNSPDTGPTDSLPELLPPPADSPFSPQSAQVTEDFALALVRAMIAAAKADGHIDATERGRIMDKIQLSGLGAEAEAFIEKELASPSDLDALIASAKTEEQKVELYTASRLAIEPDGRAERGYLDLLAGRLGLPDALVDHIEATVAAAAKV